MSATVLLLLIGALWLFIGIACAIVMGRRGHSWFMWLVLGLVLGPLTLVLAGAAVLFERRSPVPLATTDGSEVDVVVGVDGSPESRAVVPAVVALLGPRLQRVALVTVMDREHAETRTGSEDEARVREMLAEIGASLPGHRVETAVIAGRASDELIAFAARGGYELIAIGSRGRGLSKALLGSVASRLAHGAPVPVLMVGPEAARRS